MHRFSNFVLLLVFSLLLHVFPLQAATDSVQITSVSIICGKNGDGWGASYSITASYTANGHRIINEILVIGGGGRTDAWHHVDAGIGTVSGSGGLWGGFWTGYPYTVDLMMELYAATTVEYVDAGFVYNGPLVARSTASAVCTEEGPAEVIISEGVPGQPSDPGKPFDPADGRIQPDPAAPVSVYCRDYGIDVYRINDDSTGSLFFTTTNEEIEAVGETPAENTLLEAYDNIRLYRLTTGEFQLNAGPDAEGKEYVRIWDGC